MRGHWVGLGWAKEGETSSETQAPLPIWQSTHSSSWACWGTENSHGRAGRAIPFHRLGAESGSFHSAGGNIHGKVRPRRGGGAGRDLCLRSVRGRDLASALRAEGDLVQP